MGSFLRSPRSASLSPNDFDREEAPLGAPLARSSQCPGRVSRRPLPKKPNQRQYDAGAGAKNGWKRGDKVKKG